MKKIYTTIAILIVIVTAIGTIYHNTHQPTQTKIGDAEKPVIRIGAPLSLTGDASSDGQSIKEGMELAQHDLAEQGIQVEFIYEDDATDPSKTISAVNNILLEKPQAVIGLTWSFLASSAAPILDNAQVPFYMPANTSEFVETDSKYAFFGSPKNAQKQTTIEEFFRKENVSTLFAIVDQTAWAESHIKALTQAGDKENVEIIVEHVPYEDGGNSIAAALTKAKSLNADGIFYESSSVSAADTLLKTYTKLGLNDPLISSEAWIGLDERKILVDNLSAPVYIITTDANNEFVQKFHSYYDKDPNPYTVNAYDGVMLLVDAIQNTDGSGPAVSEYLHHQTNYQGFGAQYNFTESGDIENGTWQLKQLN